MIKGFDLDKHKILHNFSSNNKSPRYNHLCFGQILIMTLALGLWLLPIVIEVRQSEKGTIYLKDKS